MPNNAIAGTAFIKVDSKQYSLGGSFSISPATRTREGVAGLSGTVGWTESPRVPFAEGDGLTPEGFSAKELEGIRNATVTIELVNGRTYVLTEAWQAGEITIDAAAGTVSLRFEGMDCVEM